MFGGGVLSRGYDFQDPYIGCAAEIDLGPIGAGEKQNAYYVFLEGQECLI